LCSRAPSAPGKTRLTAALATAAALALRRAMLLDTDDAVCAAGEDVIAVFTPPDRLCRIRVAAQLFRNELYPAAWRRSRRAHARSDCGGLRTGR